MTIHQSKILLNRRQFFTKSFVGGTSLCFGCSYFISSAYSQEAQNNSSFQHKVDKNSEMSYRQVFNFAFRDTLIPQLITISRQIGREKFIEMLKNVTDEVWFQNNMQKSFNSNLPDKFWNHVLNLEVLEKSENLQIYKITKCLWADTFREADASDIGYALWCYGDYAMARSEHKKLERKTTLMEGHDHCLLKYTKET